MASWILVFAFTVPNNANFNKPVIMDHFTTKAQCEESLLKLRLQYKEFEIPGEGFCWGEQR